MGGNGGMKRWDRRADGSGFGDRCGQGPGTRERLLWHSVPVLGLCLLAGVDPFAPRAVSKTHNDEERFLTAGDCCRDGQDGQL